MFGGLTKTSSRIAIAAAFGLTLGGYALSSGPALAADFGGDCCADLEERVAELEATTVRKGNKKVSVTISGWVVKTANYWDDGGEESFAVGDKDYDLASRFAITGSATIAPGWSGGYNLTITAPGTTFGVNSGDVDEFSGVNSRFYGGTYGVINTLYSYVYLKSDNLGTLNLGHLSPASDNPAVLADISGTVIESNFVFFEGGGFGARPKGAGGAAAGPWNFYVLCSSGVAPGTDCFGAAEPAVRYDSPTWGGFRFETSYGTAAVVPSILDSDASRTLDAANFIHPTTSDSHFWDAALFYTGDWNTFQISLAGAYTWLEANPLNGAEQDYYQVGGSVMHKPSGIGVYAMASWEDVGNSSNNCIAVAGLNPAGQCLSNLADALGGVPNGTLNAALPDTDMWGVKPFIKRTWNPAGATVLYGEYAQYNDMYGLANVFTLLTIVGAYPNCASGFCNVVGSEAERWGVGVVQEIDSAAMHVFARWQHQTLDVELFDLITEERTSQGFHDTDLFQVGGIIFF